MCYFLISSELYVEIIDVGRSEKSICVVGGLVTLMGSYGTHKRNNATTRYCVVRLWVPGVVFISGKSYRC